MPDAVRLSTSALIVIALLWLGALAGVSFIATPAKFLAPSLDLPVALDVGRHTFAVFTKVESVLAIASLALAWVVRRQRQALLVAALLALIVAAETFWLLPVLDARVETIIQGGVPEASRLHSVYVAMEGTKALALIMLARAGFHLRCDYRA